MTDLIERTLRLLGERLSGGISRPGDDRYAAATAIYVTHRLTTQHVQSAIRATRDCDLPLSVRGGGHDPAGRALWEGLVIDLRGVNSVEAYLENCTARIGGGARASDVVKTADPLGLAPVTGAVGAVGMAGLTLGPLILQRTYS